MKKNEEERVKGNTAYMTDGPSANLWQEAGSARFPCGKAPSCFLPLAQEIVAILTFKLQFFLQYPPRRQPQGRPTNQSAKCISSLNANPDSCGKTDHPKCFIPPLTKILFILWRITAPKLILLS